MIEQECRPPPGTPDKSWALLFHSQEREPREWLWEGESWVPYSGYFDPNSPQKMAVFGWRFHSLTGKEPSQLTEQAKRALFAPAYDAFYFRKKHATQKGDTND